MQEKKQGAVPVGAALEVIGNGGGVVNTPPRARTRVVRQPCSHTEILEESLCSHTTRARARVREGGKVQIRDKAAYFRAWRDAKFGGDFDPVREVVLDAIDAFSSRQPETDFRVWLKVANEIGHVAFLELYREQKSIMDDCIRRGNPLRHPAAAFQARLNRYTGHGRQKGGAA